LRRVKKVIFNTYAFINSFKYLKILLNSIYSIFDERVYSNKKHIKLASDWLLFMQNHDGGYSRKFSFIDGKDKSYIETTGYIIPSLIKVGIYLGDKKYINSALKAGKWLLEVQNSDGSFSEIDTNKPYAFDTGQCLIGLNYLYEYTKDDDYLQASKKASYWLMNYQEDDGSWESVAYNNQKHTYYSRVASAMYQYAIISNDEVIKKSALKHIQWVIDNQLDNGYFKYSSFLEDYPAYLHTLVYVLEGLLDIYEINKDETILKAILKNTDSFKNINLNRDVVLCSQYDENYHCVNSQRCITGLAQWAGVAIRVYHITKDEAYKRCAINTIYYLKAKQLKDSFMRGGFSASVPFWGRYGAFSFVNWSNKFFIDSMLMYNKLNMTKIDEQESFVGSCFGLTSVVTDDMSHMDRAYLGYLKRLLPKDKSISVLDIGCGKGVIIEALKKEFPKIEFIGVDPVYSSTMVQKGSIYTIPFEDESFNIVMSFEVLQHTYINKAINEIYRVLKPQGSVVIGERNPYSILGFLKPFYELTNRWMYPFDTPFREKWYSKRSWEYLFSIHGFDITKIIDIEGSGKKWVNRYFMIIGEKR
jgi:ubiquinone/menaquinone biosynthesis C-methylase UbiE